MAQHFGVMAQNVIGYTSRLPLVSIDSTFNIGISDGLWLYPFFAPCESLRFGRILQYEQLETGTGSTFPRAPVSSRTIRRSLAEGHLGSRPPLRVLPLTPTHRRFHLVGCRPPNGSVDVAHEETGL
ncbi:hypothetical protein TNCV_1077851 [Trichonephila clavipes]|uniref:Uncharacterized protein n=1 Tax=Trichonephila clavipes TaxID=2585209 RepID=A0A8X6RRH3_TRICX|nr:hypothetical protein TNCV_1077851 [Trichonephila clavipes]